MISLQTTSALSGEVVCSCQSAEDCLRMVVGEEEGQNWDVGNAGMVFFQPMPLYVLQGSSHRSAKSLLCIHTATQTAC